MNALAGLFANARPLRPIGGLATAAAACALLTACAVSPFRDAQVDPNSPIAADVARVARTNTAWPKFTDIPQTPKDVRPPGQYGQDAAAVTAEGDQLARDTAPETWSITGTDEFAAKARAVAGSEAPPTANGRTSSFGAEQRKRATPPPPPRK